jgi:predicted glycoside hydrolase/deacetylase ChbG (UPF0249 family)
MIKNIIICADDYAQNIPISEGILRLAHQNRLNAISCLVNAPLWHDLHLELDDLKSTHFIGLHFNLTQGEPLSAEWRENHGATFSGIGSLLKKSYLNKLSPAAIEAEIHAQYEAFTEATGMAPDFIDGHQHVHQLPQIRDVLLGLHIKYQWTAFLRHTYNGWRDFVALRGYPKQPILAVLGGYQFQQALLKQSIPSNTSFSGIYNFNKSQRYARYFRSFLQSSNDGGLIMCHPGEASADKKDPLYHSRQNELAYLLSEEWADDLKQSSCILTRKGISQ